MDAAGPRLEHRETWVTLVVGSASKNQGRKALQIRVARRFCVSGHSIFALVSLRGVCHTLLES